MSVIQRHFEKLTERTERMSNENLRNARSQKNDEYFTLYEDIEKELEHYTEQFEDKIVYCNCDNPDISNFYKYFKDNFKRLKLKRLIATHYIQNTRTEKTEFDGETETRELLNGNGDFRSDECIDILKGCDIVITNPPFSLFRSFVAQLIEHNKKFLIIGSQNAITYKEIFPLLKDNKMWLGNNHVKEFRKPDGTIQKFGNICWFTNLDIKKRHEPLKLTKHYTPEEYPRYDNYNAINVNKIADIPCDYNKYIGVPITFIDKYCPEQFEIIGHTHYSDTSLQVEELRLDENHRHRGYIDGQEKYARILIKLKDSDNLCNGIIGVPITYIDKHNPDEFEIIGVSEECGVGLSCGIKDEDNTTKHPLVEGKKKYARIFIKPKEDTEICNGVIGVPISFLEKFNPEQFEILGLTSGRNEFDKEAWPIKKYEKAIQHNKDGSTTNGSKANTRATLIIDDAKSPPVQLSADAIFKFFSFNSSTSFSIFSITTLISS